MCRPKPCPMWALAIALLVLVQAHVAASADQARAKVESCFDQLIEARSSVPPAPGNYSTTFVSNHFAGLEADDGHRVAPAVELVSMASQPHYRAALLLELRSRKPAYRGLACEALGSAFGIDAVRPLGALLDDHSTSAPVIDYRTPQSGPDSPVWFAPSVSAVARRALGALTGIQFQSKADFDAWWKPNSGYEQKLWYWAAKWSWEWREAHNAARASRGSATGAASIDDLSRIPQHTALKILLLVQSRPALEAELKSTGPAAGPVADFNYPTDIGPSSNAVTCFIRDRKLQPKLLALLNQDGLYAEVDSAEAFAQLVSRIAGVASGVFGPDDEPRIAAAQQVDSPFRASLQSFAFLRAATAPDRAQWILADALRADPTLAEVCRSLVLLSGSSQADAIKECFGNVASYQRVAICDSVRQAARRGRPVDKVFLADLVRVLKLYDEAELKADYDAAVSLKNLAEAARTVAGPDVVSEEEVRSITPVRMKASTEEVRRANSQLKDAFAVVKAKLLRELM